MKEVSPTQGYRVLIPEDVCEELCDEVASFWRHGSDVALQLSSYMRIDGSQVTAQERLHERLAREDKNPVRFGRGIELECPDLAQACVEDGENTIWVYVYAVWPDLTIFASISGSPGDMESRSDWAFDALSTIRR